MQDLIYDIIIGAVFVGIIYVAISVFNSNIGLVEKSTNKKAIEAGQIDENSYIKDSLYTTADIIAYINDTQNKEIVQIIIPPSLNYTIDNNDRPGDINAAKPYLKAHLDFKYKFAKVIISGNYRYRFTKV